VTGKQEEGGNVFFVILLGLGLIAVGVGATFGGAWATVGAVVLLAIGLKVLFMGTAFGFFRRRSRARWHRYMESGEEGRRGPWPCGRHSEAIKARMDEWHAQAHAGAGPDAGDPDHGGPAAE
jgi:hypothetical protein